MTPDPNPCSRRSLGAGSWRSSSPKNLRKKGSLKKGFWNLCSVRALFWDDEILTTDALANFATAMKVSLGSRLELDKAGAATVAGAVTCVGTSTGDCWSTVH